MNKDNEIEALKRVIKTSRALIVERDKENQSLKLKLQH